MPRIIVQAISGRTVEQKRDLAKRLTDAVVEAWGVDPDIVTLRFEEVPPENFARAGQLALDRPKEPAS
ncbi:MAG TPA: tautomerase family protein [Candidatus Saccharimonadales bacterium]|nr:tautomerase family protein [Candidatus Saccharimonadales bacterium]